MNIELKKVKAFRGREGYGLNAEVWVDGVKTFFFMDDASGSIEADHSPIYNQEKYKELEKYAASLPHYPLYSEEDLAKYKYNNGEQVMMPVTIDHLVDDLYDEMETKKAQAKHEVAHKKRLAKLMLNTILWGTEEAWKQVQFNKGTVTIATMLSNPKGVEAIKNSISRMKELVPDGRLLNTNIPQELLK